MIEADKMKFARKFYCTSHHKISSKSVEFIRKIKINKKPAHTVSLKEVLFS